MSTMEQKCANVCKTTTRKVLTADEMMQVVSESPACVPLCEQMQATGKYVSREGVGFVQMDSFPRDDLIVVSPEMAGRVDVPHP
jgi:hypothetical protein